MGCRSVPAVLASPSIVVTDLPSAATVRSVQLFIETPSTWTTQAPHCEVSQPTGVPVRLSVSRPGRAAGGATPLRVAVRQAVAIGRNVPRMGERWFHCDPRDRARFGGLLLPARAL